MTVFARRLAGASLIYGLGGVLSRMVGLLLLPLLTRYLAPGDYGVIAMLAVMTNLLLGAVTLGTGNSMGICFHEAKESAQRSAVVWSTAAVVISSAAVWTLAGVSLSSWISELLFSSNAYAVAVSLAFGQLAVSAAVVPLLGRWRLEEKARPYVAATLSLTLATTVVNLYLVVVLERGLFGMLWGTFAVQAFYCVVLYLLFALKDRPRIEREWMQRVVRVGWPSIFGVGAFFLLDFGGRVMINHFAGLSALGVYSIGLGLGLGMAIFAEQAFGAAWPAFFLSFYDKRDEAAAVFGRVLQYYLLVFLTLAAAFFLLAKPVVETLVTEPFHGAAHVVGFIALCSVLKGVYLIFLPGLYFHQKLHIQTGLEWIGALVGLLACGILVPKLGIVGAASGTLVGYLVLCVATAIVARRYLPIVVDMPRLALQVAVFAGIAALSFVDLGADLLRDWLMRGTIFVLFAVLVCGGLLRDVWRDMWREFQLK